MRRWTVEEYHTMIRAGVFSRDEQFELLEGWVVPKMSRNPPRDVALELTNGELRRRLPPGWHVRVQSAITTHDSEPEPDLALVRGDARAYGFRHPAPQDIALVVEVSESSLSEDRRQKYRVYASAAIPVFWIVNVVDGQVEVFSGPSGVSGTPSFARHDIYKAGQEIPLLIDGRAAEPVAVNDLLP
jgi:Uma2 family endonuclease